MESFLRVPFAAGGAPAPRPPEFHIWRPMIDLGDADEAVPKQIIGIEMAFHNMGAPAGLRLPTQSRPGPFLRARLTEAPELRGYALEDPARMPAPLRTPRWEELCGWCEDFPGLEPARRVGLAVLLASVGLYRYLATLPVIGPPDDPDNLLLRVRTTHARAALERTPEALADSVRALEDVLECGGLPTASRLGAATTLVVLHSQSRLRDGERVDHFCLKAARLADRLAPDADWRDLLHLSTYWRAVSFAPFLKGDHAATAEQLDLAESFARRLPDGTPEQRWVRDQNHHPLMETRAKAAAAAGEFDRALAHATELRDHDPLDGKVHILLGELHTRRGEPGPALEAYLTAAALGPPYHALAWSRAAQVAGNAEDSAYALMCAHRSDPRSITPLILQERAARELGDERLARWAKHTARALQAERQPKEEPCALRS